MKRSFCLCICFFFALTLLKGQTSPYMAAENLKSDGIAGESLLLVVEQLTNDYSDEEIKALTEKYGGYRDNFMLKPMEPDEAYSFLMDNTQKLQKAKKKYSETFEKYKLNRGKNDFYNETNVDVSSDILTFYLPDNATGLLANTIIGGVKNLASHSLQLGSAAELESVETLITAELQELASINEIALQSLNKEQKSKYLISEAEKTLYSETPPGPVKDFENKLFKQFITEQVKENYDQIFNNKLEINDVKKKQIELEKNINIKFEGLQKYTVNKFIKAFEITSTLAANQEIIYDELKKMNKTVQSNVLKIKQNELFIKNNSANIESNRVKINDNRNLINANRYYISVLNGYMFNSLDVDGKLKALRNKELGTVALNEPERKNMIKSLELIRTTETLYSVASSIGKFGQLIQGLNPESKNVKAISNVLNYGSLGLELGLDIVTMTSPMDFIDFTFKIMGLFGEPQKSPELQYLEVIDKKLDIMDEKLNAVLKNQLGIFENLETIDKKVSALLEYSEAINSNLIELRKETFDYYVSTMNSLEFITEELARVNFKTDVLIEASRAIYLQDYDQCEGFMKDVPVASFNEHQVIYNSSQNAFSECLSGIQKIARGKQDFAFLMSTYINPDKNIGYDMSIAEAEIREIYTPAFNFYTQIHKSFSDRAYLSLLFPANNRTKEVNQLSVAYFNNNIEDVPNSNLLLSPGNYLNYEATIEIADRYLNFFTFFELEKNADFEPMSLSEFLVYPANFKVKRNEKLTNDLIFLLEKVDQSIAQQSLISGQTITNGIYNSIFFGSNKHEQELAARALRNNAYIQSNFLKKLVYNITNNSIEANNALNSIYSSVVANEDLKFIQGMNGEINRLNLPIYFYIENIVHNIDSTKIDKELRLNINVGIGSENDFSIPVKDFYGMFNEDLNMTAPISRLLEVRSKLQAKIDDLMTSYIIATDNSSDFSPEIINYFIFSEKTNSNIFNLSNE